MLITFVRDGIGGIGTIWRSIQADDARVSIIYYQYDNKTFIDKRGVFHFNIFASRSRIFKLLARHLSTLELSPNVFVANEEFDLEFLNWLKPDQPIVYIAHVNADHSYKAALRFKGIIDLFLTVADPAACYLQCRGLNPVERIIYSIRLPHHEPIPKEDIVIYLGRFACDKNILETSKHLEYFKDHGYSAYWIGNGPEETLLSNLSSCTIINNIDRAELYKLLARTKFLFLNSYYEGLPIILFECMHFGVFPILSYVDTSCDEILDGRYLIAAKDPSLNFDLVNTQSFTFPSIHHRINNTDLNRQLVTNIISTKRSRQEKRFTYDGSILDRSSSHLTSELVAKVRRLRWRKSVN